jgi:ribokinase
VRHLHLTYGSPQLALRALRIAAGRGLPTSLDLEAEDVAGNPELLRQALSLVDTLFLNEAALARATRVLGQIDLQCLRPGGEMIVTAGSRGCRRITAEGTTQLPAFPVVPVDTTGAGDCFSGTYIACRLEGRAPLECLEVASATAALSTLGYGAQSVPQPSDVKQYLRRHHNKIASKSALSVDES